MGVLPVERVITEDFSNGIRERFYFDDATQGVRVERTQDVEPVLNRLSTINASGGVESVDGMGVPICEVPISLGIAFCERRGIPVNAFLYGNDYNDEFLLFMKEHPKLVYEHRKKFHAL
jgi:hypothetical protein